MWHSKFNQKEDMNEQTRDIQMKSGAQFENWRDVNYITNVTTSFQEIKH